MVETRQLIITQDQQGQRLDKALADAWPDLSRSRLKSLILEGNLLLWDKTITDPSHCVKQSEVYALNIPESAPAVPEPQDIPLTIIYEDDQLVVIDKPAGLVVHPAPGNRDNTLVNALLAHCGESLSGIGGVKRPGIVHRLDKDTSGVMVIAKTDVAHHSLTEQFSSRSIERAYYALVWGMPNPPSGKVEGNIGRHPQNRQKMAVVGVSKGKPAITNYKTLKTYQRLISFVECRLETGRTHQIRVHMSHIGNPILGDHTYSRSKATAIKTLPEDAQNFIQALDRQALHAYLLGFVHPTTGQKMSFKSPTPHSIQSIITNLGI